MRRLLLWLLLAPTIAHAHGRPASMQRLRADPRNPSRMVAQATWGLALSDDGGDTWAWICAAAYGVDARMEDPRLDIASTGEIQLATYNGLYRSRDGCDWARSEVIGNTFVPDVVAGRYAAVSSGDGPDMLLAADADEWLPTGVSTGPILIDRLLAADDTLYLSGHVPRTSDTERALFFMRGDRPGAFDEIEIPAEEGEYAFHVMAVHPTRREEVWGVALHFNGETEPERVLRSVDGGQSWETVLRAPQVGGIVVRDREVLVGSKLGGIWRATDDSALTQFSEVRVRCLAEVGAEVWVCGDTAFDGFALATLEGDTLRTRLLLEDIVLLHECPTCSMTGSVCPAWLPDVVYDLGIDPSRAGIDPPMFPDGGTGAPRDAAIPRECRLDDAPPGCDCRAVPGRAPALSMFWLAALVFVCWRRRQSTPTG